MTKDLPKGEWSESAKKVLAERYLLKDETGKVLETPEEMCWRVASALAKVEEKWGVRGKELRELTEEFYKMMVSRRFLPNSPTLANAGRENKLQLSACYVLPVEDSLIGIFDAIKNAAIIHQSGGGTGFAFSRLRPHASYVASSGGQASGPVGFMRIFDAATQEVKQGGIRRGANMGVLRVDHPDILEFIECKLAGGITNFNISVGVTDKFMEALEKDTDYELINPHTHQVVKQMSARDVFEKIYQAAWKSGDPGMIWLDRINKGPANPVPSLGPIEATNPCGEQPLYPNEACNLGSLNVSLFVKDLPAGRQVAEIDWKKMKEVIHKAIRLLDNVIEGNPYPLPEIDAACKANRRIGLGVMGWADLLFQLQIPYESSEALELAEKLMSFITEEGHKASQKLADVRGPFTNFKKSIYSQKSSAYKKGPKMRNATVTTIAPTGTISIIADCSSGIEPIFALSFSHIVGKRHLKFVNPYFLEAAQKAKISEEILQKIEEDGRINGLDVPEKLKKVFKIAHEIAPDWHVKMQAAFQKYTDNAVSKTINLPHDALAEDVRDAYLQAYKLGCMGITVFRDGSKSEQVLHVGKEKKLANGVAHVTMAEIIKKPRPEVVAGATYRMETPLGTAFITINQNEGEPLETFINIGKAGSDVAAEAEALGRMISLMLRIASSLPVRERAQEIVNQLQGIGGAHSLGFGEKRVRSLPDAIAKALALHFDLKSKNGHDLNGTVKLVEGKTDEAAFASAPASQVKFDLCPKCGEAAVAYEEGCRKCHSCGYSEC